MSKIKVLYIIDQITDITAGTERQLSLLVKNLDRERFEPHLLALRPSEWLESDHFPCPAHCLDMGSVLSVSGLTKLTELKYFIADNNFHIVQTYFPDSNVVGVLAAKRAGCRIIFSTRRNTGFFYNSRLLIATKFANRHVSRFLANSELVVKAISEKEGIDQEQFSVIHNGLEAERFRIAPEDIRSARVFIGASEDDTIVGIVANLRPVKDHETFIRAAAKICQSRNDIKFVVIGGGDDNYQAQLKRMARGLSIGSNIKFLGSVENPSAFIKNFDVGVLTSKAEGLSNTLMEYGALGIPSVATDVGGNPEVVQDGKTGLLVPVENPGKVAEAVNQLLRDKDRLKEMGSEASKAVWSKFNLTLMVKLHQALYTRMYDEVTSERKLTETK
ncbi:MAG: glycosyltransferase [candidate division Zixibacteria bacterium]|nr:glycosyltransferase [candidate division Zixibacteria bacterium]